MNVTQENKNSNVTNNNSFRAGPLKIYRKEIKKNCISDKNYQVIENTLIKDNCNSCVTALSRIRTSGVITKNYSCDTRQYLEKKNRTIIQNQYNNLYYGLSTVKPGDPNSINNVYKTNNCSKNYITSSTINYIWLDGTTNVVSFPIGFYNVYDLNNIFKNTMISNKHYFINNITGSYIFLLNINFNYSIIKVILEIFVTNPNMIKPNNATWIAIHNNPIFVINSGFSNIIGFNAGSYPLNQNLINNISYSGDFIPQIIENFVPVYYKPSNYKFSNQGGVTASEQILRKQYETITTNDYLTKNNKTFPITTYPNFTSNHVQQKCTKTKLFNG
jgi:hypothetical protein